MLSAEVPRDADGRRGAAHGPLPAMPALAVVEVIGRGGRCPGDAPAWYRRRSVAPAPARMDDRSSGKRLEGRARERRCSGPEVMHAQSGHDPSFNPSPALPRGGPPGRGQGLTDRNTHMQILVLEFTPLPRLADLLVCPMKW
jgi:hypothetical protein